MMCWLEGYVLTAVLLAVSSPTVRAGTVYSTNAICQQKRCVNPVFPALSILDDHDALEWQCLEPQYAAPHMDFCKGIVNYMIGVKSPSEGNRTVRSVVMEADQAAASAYFYHLSAMGIEAWEHVKPDDSFEDGSCVRSVQDMVCATFFPRARLGCQMGQATNYLRPCRATCDRYIEACGVQCCDESVQCVFDHSVVLLDGTRQIFHGYVNDIEGSASCTGNLAFTHSGSMKSLSGLLGLVLAVVSLLHAMGSSGPSVPLPGRRVCTVAALAVISVSLQGCNFHYHHTANWRQKPHYMTTFEYVPPMATEMLVSERNATLNSCEMIGLDPRDQCNGHGECRQWDLDSNMRKPMLFCACQRDWADPECRTRRKSQATAFWLSLFGGFLGLDRFYLQQPAQGAMKLASLGGCGFWWAYDIVLIGSDPIYAGDHRVAYDLSHWLYVFASLGFFSFLGLVLFVLLATKMRRLETRQSMLYSLESAYDEQRHRDFVHRLSKDVQPSISSYGVPVPPLAHYGATAAPEIVQSTSLDNTHAAYNTYAGFWNAMKQQRQESFASFPVLRSMALEPRQPSQFLGWSFQ